MHHAPQPRASALVGETGSPRQQLPFGRPFSDVCSSDHLSRAWRGSLPVLRRALLGAPLPHRDGGRGEDAGLDLAPLGVGDGGWNPVRSCGNFGEMSLKDVWTVCEYRSSARTTSTRRRWSVSAGCFAVEVGLSSGPSTMD